MRYLLSITLCLWAWLCANAQNIVVEDFKQLHKIPILQKDKFATDKHCAIVDFITGVKGLQFAADGKTPAEATDIDGGVSVTVPSGTSYIKISHPQYGTLFWREPGMRLKAKRRYQATLVAYDPDGDFKPTTQWLVFEVSPKDALLQVDSTTYKLRDGYKELELPLGAHGYCVYAPFHDTVTDSVTLDGGPSERLRVSLQPLYSYLTVRAPLQHAVISVDNQRLGSGCATSQRLSEGRHTVTLAVDGVTVYDGEVSVAAASKPTLTIAMDELAAAARLPSPVTLPYAAPQAAAAAAAATAAEEGGEASPAAEPVFPTGYLSISCDTDDAYVYIDGVAAGVAPLTVGGLSAKRSHEVRIKKAGCDDAVKIVTPVADELTEVKLKLKKK